jgi:hypothetical protein
VERTRVSGRRVVTEKSWPVELFRRSDGSSERPRNLCRAAGGQIPPCRRVGGRQIRRPPGSEALVGATPTARRALELETGTSNEFIRPSKTVDVTPLFRPKSKTSISSRTEGIGVKPASCAGPRPLYPPQRRNGQFSPVPAIHERDVGGARDLSRCRWHNRAAAREPYRPGAPAKTISLACAQQPAVSRQERIFEGGRRMTQSRVPLVVSLYKICGGSVMICGKTLHTYQCHRTLSQCSTRRERATFVSIGQGSYN